MTLTGVPRGQHLLEQPTGPMLIGPLAEVIEIELPCLDIKDSLHVIDVFAAIKSQRPTKLRDDYVFGSGDI